MNLKPSKAQISAGNYKMRHDKFQGLDISIENPKGSERRGIGKDGNPWSVKMPHDYGYIKGTEGADGDHVDVYVGHHKKSPHVFVIDQHDCDSGKFDEHKCMLGFANADQAAKAYDKGFSDNRGEERRRSMLHLSVGDFKEWLKAGNAKKSVKGFARGGRINKAEGGRLPWEDSTVSALPWEADKAPAAPKKQETSVLQALAGGIGKGATANWQDELEGLEAASGVPEWNKINPLQKIPNMLVGAGRMMFSDDARNKYTEGRDAARARQKKLEEEHPVASTLGELGGSLVLPGGSAKTIGQAARLGAGYGLAAGLGEGEGLADTAVKGGLGTAFGAGLGAIAPKVAEKAGDVLGWAGDKFRQATTPFRRMKDPEAEAVPYFMEKMKQDVASGKALTQDQLDFARKYGMDVMGGDLGGEEVRGLARWASDTSPTARGQMNEALNERYRSQGDRLANFLENFTLAPNARVARETLQDSAEKVNAANYKRAMAQGQNGFTSDVIDSLMDAPIMQEAVNRAGKAIKNQLASGRTVKGFHIDESGQTLPTLEFLNQTKKELDAMFKMAQRSGDDSLGADITIIKKKLLGELDEAFPDYKKARGVAAEFFGADDAIDAGKEMFKKASSPDLKDSGILELMNNMGSSERGLVAGGYLTAMADKVRAENFSSDVVKRILKSPQAKELNERILGPTKAKELETAIFLEGYANRLREAVQGNSKTNQLIEASKRIGSEIGWAGAGVGAGSLLGGGINPTDPSSWPGALAGMMFKRSRDRFTSGVNEKFAQKIAELVISNDPKSLQQATKLIAKNPYAKRALESNFLKLTAPQTVNAGAPLKVLVGPRQLPAEEEQQ